MSTPTAPLPPAAEAALSRLDRAFAPAIAEQHRIERVVAGLRNGESTVINGTPVTAVSLAVAEAVACYRASEARANELIAIGRAGRMSDLDADDLAHRIDLMAGSRATLAAAGCLDLIGAV